MTFYYSKSMKGFYDDDTKGNLYCVALTDEQYSVLLEGLASG